MSAPMGARLLSRAIPRQRWFEPPCKGRQQAAGALHDRNAGYVSRRRRLCRVVWRAGLICATVRCLSAHRPPAARRSNPGQWPAGLSRAGCARSMDGCRGHPARWPTRSSLSRRCGRWSGCEAMHLMLAVGSAASVRGMRTGAWQTSECALRPSRHFARPLNGTCALARSPLRFRANGGRRGLGRMGSEPDRVRVTGAPLMRRSSIDSRIHSVFAPEWHS